MATEQEDQTQGEEPLRADKPETETPGSRSEKLVQAEQERIENAKRAQSGEEAGDEEAPKAKAAKHAHKK